MSIKYELAIERLDLIKKLHSFDPIVIGTPPLGIAVDDSDIDIACSSFDLWRFKKCVAAEYDTFSDFQIDFITLQDRKSVVAKFNAFNWEIELFCQSIPTDQQWGVRHFRIEKRLLTLIPTLRTKVLQLKRSGLKTEPAFANALGLSGDPYEAILELEHLSNDELVSLVATQ